MIELLIWLLVLILVFGVIVYVIRLIPLPDPWRTIAMVVVGLIFILILLNMLLPMPYWGLRRPLP